MTCDNGRIIMVDALIYVPPDLPDDLEHARLAWAYAEARGLFVASVFRARYDVRRALAAGLASVVVFSRREHWDPSWGVPAEFADAGEIRQPYRPRLDPKLRERYGTLSYSANRNSLYETARLLPRGDDGGFAEQFLSNARQAP
jgi:hypothetical protein